MAATTKPTSLCNYPHTTVPLSGKSECYIEQL